MTISGSFYGKTSNSAIKPKISWTATENVEGNYSDVTAKLSYSRTDSYMTYGHWAGSLTIDGNKKSVSGKYVEITKNSNTVTISHTVRVPHNDDGTKTVTISATGGITDTTLTKTTISGSVTLTGIPRAATIVATDADIGSVSMVTIGRKSDIYTYTVAYGFGTLSGFLSESGPVPESVAVTASSLAFLLPESFYYEIPAKPSEICTLTCTTYLDGSPIGEPQVATFTVRADPARCGPQLQVSAEDIAPETLRLTEDKTVFIRYASNALCALQIRGQYGAEIVERKLNGEPLTEDTVTLERIEMDLLRFTVKDSRGYTAEVPVQLHLLPYFVPNFHLSAARADATSGDAVLQAEGSFYNGSFGATENNLQLQYQINGGEPVTVIPEIEENTFSLRAALQGLDYTQSHQISLTVSDAVSTVTNTVRINPGIPVFDWGREDVRFNVPVYFQGQEHSDFVRTVAVSRTGDTLEGDLDMDGNSLTGLPEPLEDADAVNKAYADCKTGMELLWENADPSSSFPVQDVALSAGPLNGYSMIEIHYNYSSTSAYTSAQRAKVGTELFLISISGYRGEVATRQVVLNENGYLSFKAAYHGSSTVANSYIIPVAIYGIKGVVA